MKHFLVFRLKQKEKYNLKHVAWRQEFCFRVNLPEWSKKLFAEIVVIINPFFSLLWLDAYNLGFFIHDNTYTVHIHTAGEIKRSKALSNMYRELMPLESMYIPSQQNALRFPSFWKSVIHSTTQKCLS